MKLTDVFKKEYVTIHNRANDWQEAVRISGKNMVEDGVMEPRFVDEMINAVIELGPYIALAPGIAIAHARPENGALKIGVSLAVFDTPINFNSVNDPIDLVFTLVATDHSSHIEVLSELAEFLCNEDYIQGIRNAKSIDEVYDYFVNFEKEYQK